MCKRSNYTQNAPQYEGDCEYRISSKLVLPRGMPVMPKVMVQPHMTRASVALTWHKQALSW